MVYTICIACSGLRQYSMKNVYTFSGPLTVLIAGLLFSQHFVMVGSVLYRVYSFRNLKLITIFLNNEFGMSEDSDP